MSLLHPSVFLESSQAGFWNAGAAEDQISPKKRVAFKEKFFSFTEVEVTRQEATKSVGVFAGQAVFPRESFSSWSDSWYRALLGTVRYWVGKGSFS